MELYRDNHIMVKPACLLSVPGKPPNHLDSALSRPFAINPETRVIHRLDTFTSGLMIFALTANSQRALNRQFQDRTVSKEYIAEVWGKLAYPRAQFDRVLLKPVTGRSHQLRVHLAKLGHPIPGGCEFYTHPQAQQASERLKLHATRLSFIHPLTCEPETFTSEAPF